MATTLQLTADARPESIPALRDSVAELARDLGFSDADTYAIKSCVGEAVANAVLHAYPSGRPYAVSVSVREEGDELEVAVADEGREVYELREGEHELHLGLMLITHLAQRTTFTAAPDGTTVEMVFLRPRPARQGGASTHWQRLSSVRELDDVFPDAV